MSEKFGIEFDKHIYKSLFDEIDFRDLKSLLANKSGSNKQQYFLGEFPILLERPDFTNIFSQILMTTSNPSSASEIFEGLSKLLRLSMENQFKIIISFFYSMNERYAEDTRNLFIAKCQEFQKEGKSASLSPNTVQTLMILINSLDLLKNDYYFSNTFVNFLANTQCGKQDEFKHISDIDNFIDNLEGLDDTINIEKIFHDLGPLIINNSILINRPELIDTKIDEKRLAQFIIYLCKHQLWVEDKENRYLNKVFLKSLNHELANSIDENTEKKVNSTWNLEAYYKMNKSIIDSMDVKILLILDEHYIKLPR
jgi:hypothetical protein